MLDRATRLAEANDRLRQSATTEFASVASKIEAALAVFLVKQEKFANDLAETAAAASVTTQMTMLAASAAGALLGLIICFVVARGITKPLKAMTSAMERLSAGDASITVTGQRRGDEIGAMARALDVFRQNADKIVAMMSAELVTIEIGKTITSASENDLTVRVDLSNKSGFLRDIGSAINTLLEGSNATLRGISQTTGQVASGGVRGERRGRPGFHRRALAERRRGAGHAGADGIRQGDTHGLDQCQRGQREGRDGGAIGGARPDFRRATRAHCGNDRAEQPQDQPDHASDRRHREPHRTFCR